MHVHVPPTQPSATVRSQPHSASEARPPAAERFSAHLERKRRASHAASASGHAGHASSSSLGTSVHPATGTVVATAPSAGPTAASPGGTASAGSSLDPNAVQGSVNQSEDQNMQFLQLQSQIENQSEMFTALSDVEKTQTDTIRNTAQNMAI